MWWSAVSVLGSVDSDGLGIVGIVNWRMKLLDFLARCSGFSDGDEKGGW